MGHPRERRGVSYDTEAGEVRGRTRQMLLSKNAAQRRNQNQQVSRWDTGGRGPQIESTAEGGCWRQMGQEHGEGWEGRGGGPITKRTTEGGYWGGRRRDRNREGGYKGGKGIASTGIGQQRKAGGLLTKRVEAHGRGECPKAATGGRREEGLMGSEDGTTRRRHPGGKDEKCLGRRMEVAGNGSGRRHRAQQLLQGHPHGRG